MAKFADMSTKDMKKELSKRKLSTKGKGPDLLARLTEDATSKAAVFAQKQSREA